MRAIAEVGPAWAGTTAWVAEWSSWTDGDLAAAEQQLSADEVLRAKRFRQWRDRARFTVGRSLVRAAAARELGCAPIDVRFGNRCRHCGDEAHGKPYLADAPTLDFSVAHGGAHVLIGFSRDGRIGVDIEPRGRCDVGWLETMICSEAEHEELIEHASGCAASCSTLLSLWCRKEAAAKAVGLGLSIDLSMIETAPLVDRRWRSFGRVHAAGVDLSVDGAIAAICLADASTMEAAVLHLQVEHVRALFAGSSAARAR